MILNKIFHGNNFYKLLKVFGFSLMILSNGANCFSQVSFTADQYQGCPPLTVSFTNTSVVGYDFEWYFGGGNYYYGYDTSYTYTESGNNWVSLRAYDSLGNYLGYASTRITIYDSTGEIYISEDTVCPNDIISFYAIAFADSYFWDFGDGNSSADKYTYHTYDTAGIYNVSLVLNSICGSDTLYDVVNVINNIPITGSLYLIVNPNPACPGQTVYFNSSWGYASYLWDFGDGYSVTEQYSNHTYDSAGIYPVSVTLANNCGVDTTLFDTLFVENDLPFIGAIYMNLNPNLACPGEMISFHTSWGYASYFWDFGDGYTSTFSNINHLYDSVGAYPVSVTITNECGADFTLYDTVFVENNMSFNVNGWLNLYVNPNPVCPGDEIRFSTGWGYTSYAWDFGDGSNAFGGNVYHAYDSAGIYPFSVTITNYCGADTTLYGNMNVENDLPITGGIYSSALPVVVCPGELVNFSTIGGYASYLRDFGDGITSTNRYTKHYYDSAGVYNASVTITNYCGIDTTLYHVIYVQNNIPISWLPYIFSWPSSLCPGDQVGFYLYGNYASYSWDFGNGDTSMLSSPQHIYDSSGNYPVSVTVTNHCGYDTTIYDSVNVENNFPISDMYNIYVYPDQACPGDLFNYSIWTWIWWPPWPFDDPPVSILWDFGDGDTSNRQYTDHAYSSTGIYPVSVTLTNGCGNDTVYYDTVYVENDLIFSDNWFSMNISPNPVCPGEEVQFNTGSGYYSYFWDFGDGSASAGIRDPTHVYTTPGYYTASVTISNGCGNDTTLSKIVYVKDNLPLTGWLTMIVETNPVCLGDQVNFFAWGSIASSFVWDFGDGDTAIGINTDHTYTATGSYQVTLTMANNCGNEITLYENIDVDTTVIPDPNDYYYNATPYLACPGDTVIFYIRPPGTGSYLWDFGDGDTTTLTTQTSSGNYSYEIAKHTYSAPGIYSAAVTLTNSCGNSFTIYRDVSIDNNVYVNGWATISSSVLCIGDVIEVNVSGASVYKIDFGDGSANLITGFPSFLSPINHSYAASGDYTLSVTLSNNCGYSSTFLYDITVNNCSTVIDEIELSGNTKIKIYPNPCRDHTIIEYELQETSNVKLVLYDMMGRRIKLFTNSRKTTGKYLQHVNISELNLKSGLYLVSLVTDEKIYYSKVSVAR